MTTQIMPTYQPESRSWGWLAPVIIVPLTAVIAAAGTYIIVGPHDPAAAPCLDAIDAADELNALTDEYADIAGRAVEAAGSWDVDAMEDIVIDGEAFAPRYDEALTAYEDAAAQCRAAGGGL